MARIRLISEAGFLNGDSLTTQLPVTTSGQTTHWLVEFFSVVSLDRTRDRQRHDRLYRTPAAAPFGRRRLRGMDNGDGNCNPMGGAPGLGRRLEEPSALFYGWCQRREPQTATLVCRDVLHPGRSSHSWQSRRSCRGT